MAAPTPVPPVNLPVDAGPHDVLTEWWYFTGHLRSASGDEYGFEFTIFQARRQNAPSGYLAHFAITDVGEGRFSHQARVAQGEPRLSFPLDVDGWRLSRDGVIELIEAEMRPGPGVEAPYALRLRLVDRKPAALHHGGYIDYGPPGGSYYYSRTRIQAEGELDVGAGDWRAVQGEAWMDHQWGNFVVADGGWDWYSLQLNDGTELMLYVLRGESGEVTGVYGSEVDGSGQTHELPPGAVHAEALSTWTSPHTGAVYPSGWRIWLPSGEQLRLTPVLLDQELYFPGSEGIAYWEGAVTVDGDRGGRGYVELTGYADR
ncbi:MAG: hypothetical protein M3336_00685 [Chloroflexota bacterium]|nr:hypothetical protein [Chloroflexota bacterium]